MNLFGVKLQRVFGELESLLDQRLEFTDSSSLVTEDFLGVGSSDDDLGSGVGDSDLTSRVSLLGELSSAGCQLGSLICSMIDLQELSKLGLEDTVGDELSLLRDLSRSRHDVLMDEKRKERGSSDEPRVAAPSNLSPREK